MRPSFSIYLRTSMVRLKFDLLLRRVLKVSLCVRTLVFTLKLSFRKCFGKFVTRKHLCKRTAFTLLSYFILYWLLYVGNWEYWEKKLVINYYEIAISSIQYLYRHWTTFINNFIENISLVKTKTFIYLSVRRELENSSWKNRIPLHLWLK